MGHDLSNKTTTRPRATREQTSERKRFIFLYAQENQPDTIRQLFYAATVNGVVGIEKNENGYGKIQRVALAMRKERELPYHWVADHSRSIWGMNMFSGLNDAAEIWASNYRLDFWDNRPEKVEIWLEKTALASALQPDTGKYRVDLAPTSGFASEGFVEKAVRGVANSGKEKLVIYSLYDFDKVGQDASNALGRAMGRLSNMYGIELDYNAIGLGYEQVVDWGLPTRDAKQGRSQWDYPFAAELDAIPVKQLRELVASYLSHHMSDYDLWKLAQIEDQQRAQITMALSDSGLL